jgi:hypothetical protein
MAEVDSVSRVSNVNHVMNRPYFMFSSIRNDFHETLGEEDYVMMFTCSNDMIFPTCVENKVKFLVLFFRFVQQVLLCYFCYMFNEVSTPFGKGITHLHVVAPLSFIMLSGSVVFACVTPVGTEADRQG